MRHNPLLIFVLLGVTVTSIIAMQDESNSSHANNNSPTYILSTSEIAHSTPNTLFPANKGGVLIPQYHEEIQKRDLTYEKLMSDYINKGIDINTQDNEGKTVLHHAVKNGNLKLFYDLIDHPDIHLEVKDNKGSTPLLLIPYYYKDLVKNNNSSAPKKAIYALIERGSSLFQTSNTNRTLFHRFATELTEKHAYNIRLVKMLIEGKLIQELYTRSRQINDALYAFLICQKKNPALALARDMNKIIRDFLIKDRMYDDFNALVTIKSNKANETIWDVYQKRRRYDMSYRRSKSDSKDGELYVGENYFYPKKQDLMHKKIDAFLAEKNKPKKTHPIKRKNELLDQTPSKYAKISEGKQEVEN